MKTIQSAYDWTEANVKDLVNRTGGAIGNTSAHRTAMHIVNGLINMYGDLLAEEYERRKAEQEERIQHA